MTRLAHPTIVAWANTTFKIVPKVNRVDKGDLSKCLKCNQTKKIHDCRYHLCAVCARKEIYFGEDCEVPLCKRRGDGKTSMGIKNPRFDSTTHGKMLCGSCRAVWDNMYRGRSWNELVAYRTRYITQELNRPPEDL